MHIKGTIIYTGTFRILLVKSLHAEAYDAMLELKSNELGLRFLYRITYTESLNTLNDREDQNYERTTKPTGVYLRKLEQRFMKEQREVEEKPSSTTTPIADKESTLLL